MSKSYWFSLKESHLAFKDDIIGKREHWPNSSWRVVLLAQRCLQKQQLAATIILLPDGKYLVIKSDSATVSLIIPTPLIPFTMQPASPRGNWPATPCRLVQVHSYRNKDILIWSAEMANQAMIEHWNRCDFRRVQKCVYFSRISLTREIMRRFLSRSFIPSIKNDWAKQRWLHTRTVLRYLGTQSR